MPGRGSFCPSFHSGRSFDELLLVFFYIVPPTYLTICSELAGLALHIPKGLIMNHVACCFLFLSTAGVVESELAPAMNELADPLDFVAPAANAANETRDDSKRLRLWHARGVKKAVRDALSASSSNMPAVKMCVKDIDVS